MGPTPEDTLSSRLVPTALENINKFSAQVYISDLCRLRRPDGRSIGPPATAHACLK